MLLYAFTGMAIKKVILNKTKNIYNKLMCVSYLAVINDGFALTLFWHSHSFIVLLSEIEWISIDLEIETRKHQIP